MNVMIQNILLSITLILSQVLLISNVEFTGLLNPFIYIYPILILPKKTNSTLVIFISLLTGIIMDTFNNTWGIHMSASTLIGFLRPYIFSLCATQEDYDKNVIAYYSSPSAFIKYSIILLLIHHLILFTLEAFSFTSYWYVGLKTIISTFISTLLIMAFEHIRTINYKAKQHR